MDDGTVSTGSPLPRLDRFPRAAAYPETWVRSMVSGGANALWLTEWLVEALPLAPGMRVLDLGCGRAASSVFLHRELGVEVWAADLWNDPTENLARIRDAGVDAGVHPMRLDARALPFADGFFDAVVSIDAFVYWGTDDLYLPEVTRLIRPAGWLGIAGAGLVEEIPGDVPAHLRDWWEPAVWCLHSPAWWRRHWDRTGLVRTDTADAMEDGWERWLEWQRFASPDNAVEIAAVEADRGRTLAYVRVAATVLDADS
jgi:SAM-dependent methyltransferase